MDYEANRDKFYSVDGKRVTAGLFEETVDRATKHTPPFKLSEWRKVYVSLADPTEYEPAMALVGDWSHWELIRNNVRLKPIMDMWQKEVEIRLRSEALRELMKHSKKEGGTTAAKWLAEGTFTKRDMRKKVDKQNEEEIRNEVADRVAADAERLGLRVLDGGK